MELSRLLRSARVTGISTDEAFSLDVGGISTDSRLVSPGDAFIAIDGTRERGADHIGEALARGAAVIVTERPVDSDIAVPNVTVESARRAAAAMWSVYYGSPADAMTVVCVTGTCGKTAVSTILYHILSALGEKAGLTGTLGAEACGGRIALGEGSELPGFPAAMTTPDPKYLYGALAEMKRRGCGYAVIEASSHAIAQRKLAAVRPALSGFTNLSPEHLDFHGDMESYLRAKASLFAESGDAVLCGDDRAAKLVATYVPGGRSTFVGFGEANDVRVSDAKVRSLDGSDFTLAFPGRLPDRADRTTTAGGRAYRAFVPLAGDFAVINSALALAAAVKLGADAGDAIAALRSCPPLCGRMETLFRGEFTVMRDFAHTPEAMRRALSFVRSQTEGRLVCVFGCGGDRDKTKRAPMGRIAASLCDLAVVTRDNPRTEDPAAIISDILAGTAGAPNVRVIPERREAIAFALSSLRAGDTAILLGKGHETWEIDRDGMHPFDEAQIVGEILRGVSGNY